MMIHPRWRFLLLIITLCAFGQWQSAGAGESLREYELEGTITQTSFTSGGLSEFHVESEFKLYVSGCKWLIQTIEHRQGARTKGSLKREIGSNNGTEIFEIVTPLETVVRNTNAPPGSAAATTQRARGSRFNAGTVVSNSVPVGQGDGAVAGHLWLMLASQCYLSGLTTNLLTPVYDVTASAPGNPNLKFPAKWELISGAGSLPMNVTYLKEDDTPRAVYRVTGVTNVNGVVYPTGFLFEEYNGDTNLVRKSATATVTAIRPVCSLASLLPAVTYKTLVIDRRLAQAEQPEKRITYNAAPGATLPTVAEAKKVNDRKKNPPNRKPIVIALMGTALCAPLVIFAVHLWKRRKKAG